MADIKDSFLFNNKVKNGDALKVTLEVNGFLLESHEKIIDGLSNSDPKELLASITIKD